MVLLLTTVLILSCVAMAALLVIKHWELSSGRLFFGTVRPGVSGSLHRALLVVESHIPNLLRTYWRRLLLVVWVYARAASARLLLSIEHTLEHWLAVLKKNTVPSRERSGQASEFLREVSAYKKRLMRNPPKRRLLEE